MSAGPWRCPELLQHRPGEPTALLGPSPTDSSQPGNCLLAYLKITLVLTGETSPLLAMKQNGCPVSMVLPSSPGRQTETTMAAVTCGLVRALRGDQDSPASRANVARGGLPTTVPAPGISRRAGLWGAGDRPCCHIVWARADGPGG